MGKKLKSVGSVFMAVCLAVTMSSTSLFAVVADAIETNKAEKTVQNSNQASNKEIKEATSDESSKLGWYEADKTSFTISSEDDLVLLSKIVNGVAEDENGNKVQDSFKGKTITLSSDINLNGSDFEPIGSKENPFEGTFNGQNNLIEGIETDSSKDYQALFVYNKGTIKKLNIEGKVTGKNYVAGLVVINEGIVQDIDSSVTIKATEDYIGGVVAKNLGTIDRCTNSATIDARDFMGGIVGYNIGTVKKCSNSGTINCRGIDSTYDTIKGSGGIAGVSLTEGETKAIISECANTGKIYGHYDAGGITGWNANATVINCSNTAYVEAVWDAGGICGTVLQKGIIENCNNSGYVTVFKGVQNNYVEPSAKYSYKYSGGISGFVWNGTIKNSYNSGDIYSIEQGGGIFGGDYFQAGGEVSNCITTGKVTGLSYIGNILGWSGGVTLSNNKYFESDSANYDTIIASLNAQVTSENGYLGWKNDDSKLSFTKVYEVNFGITPSDAKLVVKDEKGNELTSSEDNVFAVLNGTYTYEVSKDGYATKTGEFSISGSNKSISVKLIKDSSLWNGQVDTTWYNENDSSFKISNNNELAGLLKLISDGNDFTGKTITLSSNLNLNNKELNYDGSFNGTFNGAGYKIEQVNGNLFKTLGEKAIVINTAIDGNCSLADINNGDVANSYSLSDNSLVLNNKGSVKNCYVKSKNAVVKEGNQAVDSYNIDGEIYKEEDLSNSKIADLLNKNITSENSSYYAWTVSSKETKLTKLNNLAFNITGKNTTIDNATITLYDKDKNEITDKTVKNYKKSDSTYNLVKGTYTYKISCKGFEDKEGSIKINKEKTTADIELAPLYKTTINIEPSDATLIVKDSEGKEIAKDEDGSYYLSNGTYTYEASKAKYWSEKDTFTVDSKDQEISIKLVAVYNITFNITPSNVKQQTLEVYTSDNKLVEAKSNKTYELKAGKYTYKVKADGYEEKTGEIEVVDKDLQIDVSLQGTYDTSWYDATKDTFEITNAKQLAGLAALVDGTTSDPVSFEGKTIVITSDIEVDKVLSNILPIGNKTNKFKGTFNGQKHTITLSIDNSTLDYAGLFGYIDGANIHDVTVAGSVSAKKYKAGIVGQADNSIIENCTNKATIIGEDATSAGIAASSKNCTLNNCVNEGDVTGKKTSTAGITGTASTSSKVTNCINKGTITGNSNVTAGVVGALTSNSTIDNCANEGNVNGVQYVGGIVGNFSGGLSLTNSYNKGNVKGTNATARYVAGIAGYTYINGSGKGNIANCYNLGDITTEGGMKVAGILGYLYSSVSLENCYNLGDVGSGNQITNTKNYKNCYYLGDDAENAKTKEEFENGTVAKLLNKGVKASNKYSLWKVDENKVTTLTNKYVELSFNITPNDGKVVLKDSDGNTINPVEDGLFSYYKESLKSGEKYTYEVSLDTYEVKTGELTYNGEPSEINVSLDYIKTNVSFKSNVDDFKLSVYNKKDNKLIEPNENGDYSLLPGEYYYYASSEKYPTVIKEFTVEPVKEATNIEIEVKMESGYNISFKSNATTRLKVVIKDSNGHEIPLSKDYITYELLPGTYTYIAYADGFKTLEGETYTFTVEDKALDISLEMERIYDVDWYDKDKTEYTINTKDQLIGLAKIVNKETEMIDDDFNGKTIKLGKDIELNSSDLFTKDNNGNIISASEEAEIWTPIGTTNGISIKNGFNGIFDGDGHTISGIYTKGKNYSSLFGAVGGTVKNLTVDGYIDSSGSGGSGIASVCTGTIENCINNAYVICISIYGGGIVGYLDGGTIRNCINNGIMAKINSGAGIAGYAVNNSYIINCQNNGKITNDNRTFSNSAGLVGNLENSTIENCSNIGEVIGKNVAGITYYASGSTIKNCSNSGKLNSTSGGNTVGIVYNYSDNNPNTYENNYYRSDYSPSGIDNDKDDVAGETDGKTKEQYSNGEVATLLNSKVTKENGYKYWTTVGSNVILTDKQTNLVITTNIENAKVELKDFNGNTVKASSTFNKSYIFDGLTVSGVYKYTVSKDGFDTETGTVIIKENTTNINIELGVTVYVTISKDGEFKLSSDQKTTMSQVPIKVTDFDVTEYGYDEVYNNTTGQPTLLNLFIVAHELYTDGADDFKGTPNNNPAKGNDLFITKFWGQETTQLSYMVNNKYPGEWIEDKGYIWGSTADNIKLRTGDDINVTMYTNYQIPMFYTYFKDTSIEVQQGEKVDLELLGFNNADAYLNPKSIGISGSTITVNGKNTEVVTDKDGKASISFDEVGTYTVSAKNTDLTISGEKAVITAPSLKVKVVEKTVDVTFDADNGSDALVKSAAVGKSFDYIPEVPTKEGYTFVGWYKDTDDITTEYKSGAIYNENVTYKAKWAHVSMLGAQGKLVVDGKSGIRFGTKIYNDGDVIVEKGTLIIPANLLDEGEKLTLNTPKVAKSVGKVNYEVNKEENYVTYLGTIINIPKAQFERQMTAAAYVIYKDKSGNQYTVYSQYPNTSVSVYDLLGNNIDWDGKWDEK